MKKKLYFIPLLLVTLTALGQTQWGIDFDSPLYLDRIYNDTVGNPNCIWQVGQPSKTLFNSAHSIPNAIVTDTLNNVSSNDTSSFYLLHERNNSNPFHIFGLQFWFQMDGDSSDFGTIEISPDSGITWINMLTQDITYNFIWQSAKPTLIGSTGGWQQFSVDLEQWASGWGTFPIAMTSDTIIFRFTYITGSSTVQREGWLIDDFLLEDWYEGIKENWNNNLISISPNPATDEIYIHKTSSSVKQSVQVFNNAGQLLFEENDFKKQSIETKNFPNGIYLLKYSDSKNYSIKKFVIQH